jgi:ketosteroid isomerase-like protein
MSIEQNKAVVRRFVEVLSGGDPSVVDELLAPNYVNHGMGDVDLATFKAMLPAAAAAMPGRRMDVHDLVAEGDAVVIRFTFEYTFANGEHLSGRGITYYRLADGRIVEDDPITKPDLAELLASHLGGPTA